MDGFDIALIKLDEPCDFQVPNLDAKGNLHRSGTVFSALGWGKKSDGQPADELQIADRLRFFARHICNDVNNWNGLIKDSMICTKPGDQDTQEGKVFH